MTSIESKARRLVREGSVRILKETSDVVVAEVQGDHRAYRVTLSLDGAFRGCSCPSVSECSHLIAVDSVLHARYQEETMPPYPPDSEDPTRPFVDDSAQTAPDSAETPARASNDTDVVSEADTHAEASPPQSESVDAALLPLAAAPVTYQTLKAIAHTEFVPAALRGKPEAVLAAVLYGRELGLEPMQALAHVHVVDGRPAPSAELLLRLIREAGHAVEVLEMNDQAVRLRGTRTDDGDTLEVGFTLADAERAGLVSIGDDGYPRARSRTGHPLPWETYTPDLLWARAVSRLHRRLFPDVTSLTAPRTFGRKDDGLTVPA